MSVNADPMLKSSVDKLQCMSICGLTYFTIVLSMVMLTGVFYTIPVVYSYSTGTAWSRIAFACYLFMGVVINFAMVALCNSYVSLDKTEDLPGPDWIQCDACNRMMPPRTHHCVLCRRCILRRDHHCFFTGSCIGMMNQRYFVLFCLYIGIGCAYSLYLNAILVSASYANPLSGDFYHYFLPITLLEWLFGFQTFGFLYFALLLNISLFTMCGAFLVTIQQLFVIAKGQTSFEYINGRQGNSVGLVRNFRTVFGSYWYLKFLFPFPVDFHWNAVNFSKVV